MPNTVDADHLTLAEHGAQRYRGLLSNSNLAALRDALAHVPSERAGVRISGSAALSAFLNDDCLRDAIVRGAIGDAAKPVRAIFFDKTAETNWSLGWHQDRTIAVEKRIAIEGFGPWTTKAGIIHVAPPFEILARMITLRIHLDDVNADNAPLLVAPKSHIFGRIAESVVADAVRRCGAAICLANAGDVWAYATPILHASNASATPTHRRVLQVDFAAGDLPGGLQWAGI